MDDAKSGSAGDIKCDLHEQTAHPSREIVFRNGDAAAPLSRLYPGRLIVLLKFYCPTAQDAFDSGIWMDAQTLQRQRLKIVSLDCPLCGRTHRFMLADARFDDENVPQES